MHLMRHFLGTYWGFKSETHTVERVSQIVLTAISTSIIMRIVLTGVRRAESAKAVLSARPRPGYKGDSHRVTRAQASRSADMITRDTPLRVGNS